MGDLDTAALVAGDGTVDFLCWPHLDSPSIFAGLLDPERGGAFERTPDTTAETRTVQTYVPETNVLITRWTSEASGAEVVDLMPHPDVAGWPAAALVRRVRATRGRLSFRLDCTPRLDYARIVPLDYARIVPEARPSEAGGVVFKAEG